MVIDLGGVEPRDGDGRKEGGKKRCTGFGQLVEHQRGTGGLGQDREQAGSGRGLQHTVDRCDGGGGERSEAEGHRR